MKGKVRPTAGLSLSFRTSVDNSFINSVLGLVTTDSNFDVGEVWTIGPGTGPVADTVHFTNPTGGHVTFTFHADDQTGVPLGGTQDCMVGGIATSS